MKTLFFSVILLLSFTVSYSINNFDFGDPESSIDFGANLGFGYDFGKIRAEVFFYQGFSNIFELESTFSGNSELEIRNVYINFNVSYRL